MTKKGFTLIELLIVILVIGVLVLFAVLSLNGIQERGRDAKRVNDITNVQRVMTVVSEEFGSYQKACGGVDFKGLVSSCQGEGEDFRLVTYLNSISTINDPLEKTKACDASCSSYPCNYAFQGIGEKTYAVHFWLEKGVNGYARGCHRLSEKGIE